MSKTKLYLLFVVALIVLSCGGRRNLPPPPPPQSGSGVDDSARIETNGGAADAPIEIEPLTPVRRESLNDAVTRLPEARVPEAIQVRTEADEAFAQGETERSLLLYRRYLGLPEAVDLDLVRFRLGWLAAQKGDYAAALKTFGAIEASALHRVERMQLSVLIPLLEGVQENAVLKDLLKIIRQDAPRRKPGP